MPKPKNEQQSTSTAEKITKIISSNNSAISSESTIHKVAPLTNPIEQFVPMATHEPPISPISDITTDDSTEKTELNEKAKLLFALLLKTKSMKSNASTPDNSTTDLCQTTSHSSTELPFQEKMFIDFPTNSTESFFNNLQTASLTPTETITVTTDNIHNDFYNNYMFEFGKIINITAPLELTNFKFPTRTTPNIVSDENKFNNNKFTIDGKLIELPEKYYNRETIVVEINRLLPDNIKCVLTNCCKISFVSDRKFMLLEESLLFHLGFKKNSYVGKTMYEAEKEINIGDNMFLVSVTNICDKPLFLINGDENRVTMLANCNGGEVDYFDIKIHIENGLNMEYFFREGHEMEFAVY